MAPSIELRTWYGHDPAKFCGFRRRYADELAASAPRVALGRLRALVFAGPMTLLTATRDVSISQAAVLAELLAEASVHSSPMCDHRRAQRWVPRSANDRSDPASGRGVWDLRRFAEALTSGSPWDAVRSDVSFGGGITVALGLSAVARAFSLMMELATTIMRWCRPQTCRRCSAGYCYLL
jgi:Protein of unknown function, DUF488